MLFPEAERAIYANNPLRSVICQLRYPPILTIDADIPADFQERVRHNFPQFKEESEGAEFSVPEGITNILPKELEELLPVRGNRRYQFMTSDGHCAISLTKDSVALEARDYKRWEEFREFMELMLTALVDVYSPAYFSRVGLRYQNIIDRDVLGLESLAWHELLSSFILGPQAEKRTRSNVEELVGAFALRLNQPQGIVRVQHGLGPYADDATGRKQYLLDNDFYTDVQTPAEVTNVVGKLNKYNTLNRQLFRWCIRDRLHTAMGPTSA